jgi:large subunit ribosomal protein L21
MSYAVIQLAGQQHKVKVGDKLEVNSLGEEVGKTLAIADVLLIASDKKVSVGAPTVAGAKVTLKVVDNHKGDKIRVAKYKSKSRYRRVQGHRQVLSTVEVTAIEE